MTTKESGDLAVTRDRDPSDQEGQSPTLRMVVFGIEGQRYALPLSAVVQVLPMVAVSPLPKAPPVALGAVNLHGQVVPVLDIRRRLDLPSRNYGLSDRLLVVRTDRRILAAPVDEVFGVQEVEGEVVAPPDAVLPGLGSIAGLAERLIVIRDPDSVLSFDDERRLADALEERAA